MTAAVEQPMRLFGNKARGFIASLSREFQRLKLCMQHFFGPFQKDLRSLSSG
jgi:hypothetical protein